MAPIAQAIQNFARDKLKIQGSLYIGLSSSPGSASPTVLLCTMLLVPPLMYLAKAASFSNYLPSASLSMLPFVMVLVLSLIHI